MSWQYDASINPEEYEGFIYLVTHVPTGRMYVGKKSVWTYRKRKRLKQSNWQNYWTSSDEIKQLVKQDGKDAFKREVLHWCKTKRAMTFLETAEQFKRDVLHATTATGEHAYFNRNIMSRFFRNVLD